MTYDCCTSGLGLEVVKLYSVKQTVLVLLSLL
jgi:hypothetical protein